MLRHAVILPESCLVEWRAESELTLWYLGDDYAAWQRVTAALPACVRVAPVGDIVNRWGRRLAETLRCLDDAVDIADPAAWAASGIGCRGRYESDLTLLACYYAAFIEAMEGGGTHVFVVANHDLGRLLYRCGHERGWSIDWRHPGGRPPPSWRGWPRALLELTRARLQTVRDLMRQLRTLGRLRRRHPRDLDALRQADTVMVLWGLKTTFTPGAGLSRDGYFAHLPALLEQSGRKLAYVVQPVVWAQPYETIAANALASGAPVLMADDCYSLRQVLAAALTSLRRPARPRCLHLESLDLTPVLRLALAQERLRTNPVSAQLRGQIGPALAALGMTPRTLVHLYEGQPWERALRHGMRAALPDTRVVAIQHMPFPPLYLNFVPSAREIRADDLPDTLSVLGPAFADFFRNLGMPNHRLTVGGALRFEGLSVRTKTVPAPPVALCCAGVDWHETHELVDKAARATARLPALRLVVNFNPLASHQLKQAVRAFVLERVPAEAAGRIEFSDLGVRDLMSNAGVVLYSDTNAAFEAYAGGCALIFVGRDMALDYDKLPPGWARQCRDIDSITAALAEWLDQRQDGHTDDRAAALSRWLAPIDAAALLSQI